MRDSRNSRHFEIMRQELECILYIDYLYSLSSSTKPGRQ